MGLRNLQTMSAEKWIFRPLCNGSADQPVLHSKSDGLERRLALGISSVLS